MRSETRKGEVHPIILTFLVVAILVAGSGMFLGSVADNYGIDDSKFQNVTDSSAKIIEKAENLDNASRDISENPATLLGGQGFMAFAEVIFATTDFAQELVFSITEMVGLPLSWLTPILLAMLIVIIAFSVANWIRGGGAKL